MNKLINLYVIYIVMIILLIAAGYIIFKINSDGGKCIQNPGSYLSKEYAKYNDNMPIKCTCDVADGYRLEINENGTLLIKNSYFSLMP